MPPLAPPFHPNRPGKESTGTPRPGLSMLPVTHFSRRRESRLPLIPGNRIVRRSTFKRIPPGEKFLPGKRPARASRRRPPFPVPRPRIRAGRSRGTRGRSRAASHRVRSPRENRVPERREAPGRNLSEKRADRPLPGRSRRRILKGRRFPGRQSLPPAPWPRFVRTHRSAAMSKSRGRENRRRAHPFPACCRPLPSSSRGPGEQTPLPHQRPGRRFRGRCFPSLSSNRWR